MSQTSAIFGALIIAFIMFITVKGELPCYLQVLGLNSQANCPGANTATGSPPTTSVNIGFGGGSGGGGGIGIGISPIGIGIGGIGVGIGV